MKLLKKFKIVGVLIFSFFIIFCSFKQDSRRLSVIMDSQRLIKGKVVKINAEIYFGYDQNILTIHYKYPNDYVLITNSKGEVKVYNPKTNEVTIQQNRMFSSENDMLYTFLTNKTNDMGLAESGFKLVTSVIKGNTLKTTWNPPISKTAEISKIEMVHENSLPIYMAYYDSKVRLFKKTYYSNYYTSSLYPIPLKIVEIDYPPKGDSIISRKVYSNLKTGNEANSQYFNFQIPKNAKISNNK